MTRSTPDAARNSSASLPRSSEASIRTIVRSAPSNFDNCEHIKLTESFLVTATTKLACSTPARRSVSG